MTDPKTLIDVLQFGPYPLLLFLFIDRYRRNGNGNGKNVIMEMNPEMISILQNIGLYVHEGMKHLGDIARNTGDIKMSTDKMERDCERLKELNEDGLSLARRHRGEG